MKSHTLSQFQQSIYELDQLAEFGRTTGAKDKSKRKGKGLGITGGLVASGGLAGLGAMRLNKLQSKAAVTAKNLGNAAKGVEKNALKNAVNGIRSPEESAKLAGNLKKMAANRINTSKLAKVGKIGAGVAAGGLLAGAAVNALRNRQKQDKK